MEHGILYYAGYLLGCLWMFVWVPYAGFNMGSLIRKSLVYGKDKATPKKDPLPKPARRPKELYTVDEGLHMMDMDDSTLKENIRNHKIRVYADGDTPLLYGVDVRKFVAKPKKAKESKFNVVDSYDDEYKITNPIEFST